MVSLLHAPPGGAPRQRPIPGPHPVRKIGRRRMRPNGHLVSLRFWAGCLAWAAMLALAPAPARAASGYYNGLKLPYMAGTARIVVRSTSHGPGRHAVDFGLNYEPVLAMYGGRVSVASESRDEGRYVVIDHGDGYC